MPACGQWPLETIFSPLRVSESAQQTCSLGGIETRWPSQRCDSVWSSHCSVASLGHQQCSVPQLECISHWPVPNDTSPYWMAVSMDNLPTRHISLPCCDVISPSLHLFCHPELVLLFCPIIVAVIVSNKAPNIAAELIDCHATHLMITLHEAVAHEHFAASCWSDAKCVNGLLISGTKQRTCG